MAAFGSLRFSNILTTSFGDSQSLWFSLY
uniref:Uncharacterized protein n=1 Tax=Rhizophora mucronata TaxID=61149 RepID=A0A2P2PNJ9_RHIMU